MKYYIIAGEASGDLHASNLMKEIKANDPAANFRCWGGDLMSAQGGVLVKHYKELAFMGFWEVATHLSAILKNLKDCKKDLLSFAPHVLILVDYPGFNMRIAQFAKKNGIKVVYYISPQVWAWKTRRIHQIKRDIERMITILPFEKPFYAKYHYNADYVGHPLLDAVDIHLSENEEVRSFRQRHHLNEKPIIAILPGSRKQELVKIMPLMLEVMDNFPDYQFVMSQVTWLPKELYHSLIKDKKVTLVQNETYALLLNAEAAMVTSGTATLETAILGTRQVVCYKTSTVSYHIAKSVAKDVIKYISLVNLILDKPAVTELIQNDLNKERLTNELQKILYDESAIAQMQSDYSRLLDVLGNRGASKRAAAIVEMVAKNS